ncbi:hypothetical protein GWK18_11975 [Kocuria sp. JC486]|uniref:hypothetical protein n=1 Tax=Kocuria sp. JC486 TaxID=1970736 RepID=UPI0014223FB8|nr:hypothetical protein [Kocuria sp. JC486]NHU86281.1 hypothetical protein [Kocuria sp. JC486]
MNTTLTGLFVVAAIAVITAVLGVASRALARRWTRGQEVTEPSAERPLATDPYSWREARERQVQRRNAENAVDRMRREAQVAQKGLPDIRNVPR